jgi:hypothetical protein
MNKFDFSKENENEGSDSSTDNHHLLYLEMIKQKQR